jgi:hypothetical protein
MAEGGRGGGVELKVGSIAGGGGGAAHAEFGPARSNGRRRSADPVQDAFDLLRALLHLGGKNLDDLKVNFRTVSSVLHTNRITLPAASFLTPVQAIWKA